MAACASLPREQVIKSRCVCLGSVVDTLGRMVYIQRKYWMNHPGLWNFRCPMLSILTELPTSKELPEREYMADRKESCGPSKNDVHERMENAMQCMAAFLVLKDSCKRFSGKPPLKNGRTSPFLVQAG